MPHSIIHGEACFAYFNKIWGIPGCDVYAFIPPNATAKVRIVSFCGEWVRA